MKFQRNDTRGGKFEQLGNQQETEQKRWFWNAYMQDITKTHITQTLKTIGNRKKIHKKLQQNLEWKRTTRKPNEAKCEAEKLMKRKHVKKNGNTHEIKEKWKKKLWGEIMKQRSRGRDKLLKNLDIQKKWKLKMQQKREKEQKCKRSFEKS